MQCLQGEACAQSCTFLLVEHADGHRESANKVFIDRVSNINMTCFASWFKYLLSEQIWCLKCRQSQDQFDFERDLQSVMPRFAGRIALIAFMSF